MDNFHLDITSEGRESLELALRIAFGQHNKAVAYLVDPKKGLVFFWHADKNEKGLQTLPFKLDAIGATDFAVRWLAEAEYGPEPGHDGSNGKGWRVYNDRWGRVSYPDNEHSGWSYSFVAVLPCWAWYGK